MPSVMLKFVLPDEQVEFEAASKGMEYRLALGEFDEYLRRRLKYEALDEAVFVALEAARDELRHQLEVLDITL